MRAKAKSMEGRGSVWSTLSPWGKRAAMLAPILVVAGILAPYANSLIGTPPFASKVIEIRVAVVEQRIDLQERIAVQREVLKLEEEIRRRRLSEAEKNYLEDLKQRLRELEKRK